MRNKILTVDDSKTVRIIVRKAFKSYDCEILEAANGVEGLAVAAKEMPDLILLDVTMPVMDGVEMLTKLKSDPQLRGIPVMMLTAEGGKDNVLKIAKLGIRDYIVKPFALEELVARVQVALRRSGLGNRDARLRVADLEMDLDSHRVWRGGVEANLSPTEFNLLRCLMVNVGRVVTRAQILDSVWQYDFNGESTIVESFVSNLRKKLDAAEPKLIHTVRGVGYSIRES